MKLITSLLARILFLVPIAASGISHFKAPGRMAESLIPDLPGNVFLVYLTGVALLAAAVSILIGKWAWLASILLGILLLLIALVVHMPHLGDPDRAAAISALTNFYKDLGLAGASFFMGHAFWYQMRSPK